MEAAADKLETLVSRYDEFFSIDRIMSLSSLTVQMFNTMHFKSATWFCVPRPCGLLVVSRNY